MKSRKKPLENKQRLRPGNVLRSLSLNAARYLELKKRAADEGLAISEIVDRLIAGYLQGKIKLPRGQ